MLADLIAKTRAEADRTEAELPELRISARAIALVAKRVIDRMEQEAQARFDSGVLAQELAATHPEGGFTAEEVVKLIDAAARTAIDVCGDRILDYAETYKNGLIARSARVQALRDMVKQLEEELPKAEPAPQEAAPPEAT
jgi:hypothetical protein